MKTMTPIQAAFTVGLAAVLTGCEPKPVPADLRGGTELDFAKTTARAQAVAKGTDDKAEIRLVPEAWVDGTFALAEGQVALMSLVIKGKSAYAVEFESIERTDRRLRAQKTPEYKMLLELEFPAGVTLEDVADGKILKSEKTAGGTHYTLAMIPDFDMTFSRIKDDFNWWRQMGFLLSTTAKSGSKLPGAKAWMTWKGARFTNVETFDFAVRDRIPETPALKKFFIGCSTGGIYPNFSYAGWDKWTAMLTALGLNAMQPDFRETKLKKRQIEILRKNGVKLLTPTAAGCPVYNGFTIGDGKNRPANERFTSTPEILAELPEGLRKSIEEGTCPSAVYERMPYFRDVVVPKMAEVFAGYDGIWCNWEPFRFFGRGCYCDRCRAKFAAFAKMSEDELKPRWPKEVQPGGKLYQQFSAFLSAEHAKMMRVVDEEVSKVCGGANCIGGFIPGVAWCEMASMWRANDYAKEVRPYGYAKGFKWVSPWGPYAIYPTQEPYAYSKWRNLRTFLAARDVRAQVNRDYPVGRPKIMAYPHGLQLSAWICYPEALEMNIDSFFFNGWEAASVYHFPRGYDARWLAAFQRSAAKAAKYEDIVLAGRRIDGAAVLELTAPYAAPNSHEGTATRGLPIKGEAMLQHVAYEKDGRTIVAVFNFWEKGPAFFRIKLNGRDMGEFYCGALRTKVWEFGAGAEARGFTDADLAAWKSAVLPELKAAKAADDRFEEDFGGREYDLKDTSVGALKGRADVKRETLTFNEGDAELTVDCRHMAITSWKRGGREILKGNLAALSFTQPGVDLSSCRWRVIGQRTAEKFSTVTAELKVTEKMSKELDGLKISTTFYFFEGLRQVNVVSHLINESTDEQPHYYEVVPKFSDGGLAKGVSLKGPAGVANGAFNSCEVGMGARKEYGFVVNCGK